MEGWVEKLLSLCKQFANLFYLNLLWIIFTCLGLLILGIFPATTAMFSVVRKWLIGEKEIPIFKSFWQTYKTEFVKSNILGLFFSLIGLVIYFDFHFFQSQEGIVYFIWYACFIMLSLLFLTMLLYFFPVFVHYELKLFQYIKQTLLMAIFQPLNSILMLIGSIVTFTLSYYLRMFPFLSIIILVYFIMWMGLRTFRKVEQYKVALVVSSDD